MSTRVKHRLLAIFLTCGMILTGVTGCSKGQSQETQTESEEEQQTGNEEVLSEEEQLFEQLFDLNSYVQVKIDISNQELAKIMQDYNAYNHGKSPIYRKAEKVTFIIGSQTYEIEEVGIRMKGNTSRTDFYDDQRGIYKLCHFRLSFDETFDDPDYYGKDAKVWESEEKRQERKDRTFATLSALEIKWNKSLDNTYVRECYANDMFRDFGVLSQHTNCANMVIAGDNMGVYNIYEPVDKTFIKKYLDKDENDGDLYKAAWTMSPATYARNVTYGKEEDGGFYNYTLKTNKKKSDHSLIKNLLSTINANDVTKDSFSQVVDMDYWVRFAAVSYFVGNPDDMRSNFNNHYVYIKPNGQAIFIPYDNDRTFGVIGGWNPDGSGMTKVSPFSKEAEGCRSYQMNPLYNLTVLTEQGYCYQEYLQVLEEVANSKWMTEEYFEEYYEIAKSHYEACVAPDKDYENAGKGEFFFSLNSFEENGNQGNMSTEQYLERKLKTYRDAVSAQ